MTLPKEKIDLIIETFGKLERGYGLYPFEDEIDEDSKVTHFPFPREEEGVEIEIEHLLEYLEEVDSLEIHDFNRVTTDTITQRVVAVSEILPILYLNSFQAYTKGGIRLRILTEPILIGLAATKKDEYSKYNPPCTSHIAVEVKYNLKEERLSIEEEEKLIKSYFFELSHTYKISFSYSTFENIEEYDPDNIVGDLTNFPHYTEDYNAGMDLFIKANEAISPDLKFLSYYKIFEYFAPVYSKTEAFEAMRKKMDSSKSNDPNADYIASIFDLAKHYEYSLRDKELIKSLLNNTFDLVDIYDSLPKLIKKDLKLQKLEYSTKAETKDSLINKLGNILYNTRNSIVHAKSNFQSNGLECAEENLDELNEFMHMACYSTIKWYNRLPPHLKIT